MALEAYKAENGSYPVTSNDTIEDENGDSESVTVIDVTTDTTVLTKLLGFETFTLNDADQYPVDAWDRQLIYIPSSAYSDTVGEKVGSLDVHYNPKSFQLFSAGEDGDPDTEDDNIYNFDRK
jgi:hypothetical protein